ncbi:tetratricopeptide repeat protein [Parabacteroides hominis]|uniref:Tetratricopeptide repeat protein n=3 Tax=Parabacteroides TaxID=375288 RepID=A0ABR7DS52_9BACT|nr:tetratricopeptide repeat protein [Parabacteroides hominis]MBC5634262.1 tetratricopeptide repeat protein [Parabacteroides hominis]
MKKLISPIFLLLILVQGACRQPHYVDSLLQKAETLMPNRPDSSLILLESVRSLEKLSAEDYATWCLLVTQARDKNYVEHTSDSVINVAVRYFEKRKDPHRKAQAYYCQGRVLSDLDLEGEALEAYLRAKEQVTQTIDYDLRARINNHLGGLYWKNMNHRESLVYYKEAHQAYVYSSDTAGMVNTLCNVGKCFQGMNLLDSASIYYEKALKLADEGHVQTQKGMILTSLGNISEVRGEYVTALEYYQGAFRNADNPKFLDTEYYNLGDIYHALGQTDSALFYVGKILESGNLFTQCNANRLLYQLAKENREYASAFVYNETYLQLRDSIEHLYRPDELERVKALYNKERMQNRHDRQIQEAEIRQLLWVVLFLASLLVGTFIYFYFNKKLSLQKLRNQETMKMLNENKRQLSIKDKELSENNVRLETAQQSLSQIQEEKDRLVRERNEQVRILEEDNRKQQAKYEQQLEEIETRSKRTVEEKEKLREEKDHLVRERNERVRMLEEDNRKRQAEYEQQLEEIETRSKRTVEEKEKILREKDILINQKDLLLSQQNLKLSSMSKDEKLYKEQIGILTSEQQKTTQEIKSKEDYSSLCKMYEAWQKELISQNSCLSRIQNRLVLGIWKERDWKVFMENFNQVYPGFLTHLTGSFDLAEREIRIVCLTKLGLKTAKVSTVFNLGEDMIRRIKSDIRKRCFPTSTAYSLDEIIKKWY